MRTKSIQLNTCGSSQSSSVGAGERERGKRGREHSCCFWTHNVLPLALIYLASAIQRLSQCQTGHTGDTGRGPQAAQHNEPLHQQTRRENWELRPASLEAFALDALLLSMCPIVCCHRFGHLLVARPQRANKQQQEGEEEEEADEMKEQSWWETE